MEKGRFRLCAKREVRVVCSWNSRREEWKENDDAITSCDSRTVPSELPEDRRIAIEAVREVILTHLPAGYEEAMNRGMVTYQVPLNIYPDTDNGQPLMYAALASQKNHMAIYLMGIYINEDDRDQFYADYKATGKRLDVGKSCVRFRKIDDLPLDLIGKAVTAMPVDLFVEASQKARSKNK